MNRTHLSRGLALILLFIALSLGCNQHEAPAANSDAGLAESTMSELTDYTQNPTRVDGVTITIPAPYVGTMSVTAEHLSNGALHEMEPSSTRVMFCNGELCEEPSRTEMNSTCPNTPVDAATVQRVYERIFEISIPEDTFEGLTSRAVSRTLIGALDGEMVLSERYYEIVVQLDQSLYIIQAFPSLQGLPAWLSIHQRVEGIEGWGSLSTYIDLHLDGCVEDSVNQDEYNNMITWLDEQL